MIAQKWRAAAGGALLATASYVLFIWSLIQAPVAAVVALRETSMLFAVGIAVVVLGERVQFWRGVAVAIIFVGVILLRI